AKYRRAYEALISSPEERAGYDAFVRQWDEYMKVHGELLKLSHANDNVKAAELYKGDASKAFRGADAALERLVEINVAGTGAPTQDAAASYGSARIMTIVFAAVATMLALGAMAFVLLGIARPLLALVASMKRLGDGDFSVVLPGLGRRDEIGA